tara:strand:+ start:1502 stop:1891 length:390 start_codon:yes stop_codon:yes gene_type:complete
MEISFLCAKHADWVYSHPLEAVNFLARDEFQGTTLFYDGEYRECLPYLGCAFDITAILLEVDEGQNPLFIEKAFALSSLICDAYKALGLLEYQTAMQRRVADLVIALSYQQSAAVQSRHAVFEVSTSKH